MIPSSFCGLFLSALASAHFPPSSYRWKVCSLTELREKIQWFFYLWSSLPYNMVCNLQCLFKIQISKFPLFPNTLYWNFCECCPERCTIIKSTRQFSHTVRCRNPHIINTNYKMNNNEHIKDFLCINSFHLHNSHARLETLYLYIYVYICVYI
jgi:hypothetical protein